MTVQEKSSPMRFNNSYFYIFYVSVICTVLTMLLTFTDQVTTTVLTIDGDVPTPGGVEPFQTPSKTTSIHCSGPNVLLKRRQN